MALIVADRVKQESTTTGTGTFTLSGGVDGFQNFSAVCSTNDTMYYCIQDKIGTDFEIGHGTFNGSGQLERTNVLQSSNSDNAVDFSSGTKEVFITYPADKAVFQNYNGSITIPSTIDGRDLQTDGTKLDGIEASATADQTASEIRTLVESATDSNVFTDADHTKLNGVEASATADQTGAEIKSAYEGEADTNALTDTLLSKLNAIEASATADQTDAEIRTAVEAATDSNVFTDADHTKLNGIEASATADQTGAEIKSAYEGEADTNAFTDAQVTKLAGIATGAEVNVNADWNSSSGDSQILNKPTISAIGGATGVDFNDDVKARFGTGNDLEIYHNGSKSIIEDTGTGNLEIKSSAQTTLTDDFEVNNNANSKVLFRAVDGAGVSLYHNNTKMLESSSVGLLMSGDVEKNSGKFTIRNLQNNENVSIHTKTSNSDQESLKVHSGGLVEVPNGGLTVSGSITASDIDAVLINGEAFQTGAWYKDNAGNGTQSQRFYFYNNGTTILHSADAWLFQNNNATKFTIDSSGNATAVGNVTAYSDERLKSDVKTIDNALDKVSQMRGVTYTKDNEKGSGVIAQELEKIAPELVLDGEYKSVAYGNTVGYLIESIKELKERNEKLELIVNRLITEVEEKTCSCCKEED